MSGGPGQIVKGGDALDLRAAEGVETTGTALVQSGLAAGTNLLNALQITASENWEILALEYWLNVSLTDAAQEPVPALASREKVTQLFTVTTEEDFSNQVGVGRNLAEGDYFQGFATAVPSVAFEDPTNGTGGVGGGQMGTTYMLVDPGKDAETGPLFVREGDEINVHLRVQDAIGANAELTSVHRLQVWFAEVEEAMTDVRTQFPSREGTTI